MPSVVGAAPAVSVPPPVQELLSLVEARAAGRVYGAGSRAVTALVSATCTVAPGDRIALVGPSGSGKSTLLHLMAGLDEPTSGAISWPALGARSSLRPAKLAFVFQAPSLLPPLSVLDNVALPLLLGRLAEDEARAAAREALERLEILDLAERLPEELSGGQAQRVGLARALAYRPRLILADEPTGQLDRVTAGHVVDVLLAALTESDTALVVATHDAALAERLAQRWQMRHGTLAVAA